MSLVFNQRTTDGVSLARVLTTDIATVVAKADPNWERVRLVAELEDVVGAGTFTLVPDWEMNGPGSQNLISNGAAGRSVRLRMFGAGLTANTPSITADID